LSAQVRWSGQQYWATATNNFLDVAVLEWCKLFGERNGRHNWKKSVNQPSAFELSLLARLNWSARQCDEYVQGMRKYRDKFVAHLDELNLYAIPSMDPAISSAQHLYNWLLEHETDCDAFP
jgi:hypothetical protein